MEGGFEDFLHAYAGLLVDGSMITEFACQEAQSKKGWHIKRTLKVACAFDAHQHASLSD